MAGKSVLRVSQCFRHEIRTLKTVVNKDSPANKTEETNFFSANFKHPYKRLFPWKSLTAFVDDLEKNVVYNDKAIVAINKPWGVGIHKAQVFVDKKRSNLLLSDVIGSSKYCIADAVDILAERLKCRELRITKSIDRHMSGVMLLTTGDEAEKRVKKSLTRAIPLKIPYSTYWCITKGYPLINGPTEEKVAVKQVYLDENATHAESQIVMQFTKKQIKKQIVKPVHCSMDVKSLNKQISSALVEVSSTTNKYNFVRTYVSSKTSFILGDTRMAARIKQVLGVPIQVSPYNVGYYDDYEPLPKVIRDKLFVLHNRQIPLMIHRHKLTLPMYNRDKSDLIIETNQLPHHFLWTLQQLQLM
ncbi:RNA pseudouridylate synthase domain-containing protein 3-like protein [Leptotrombidium deliense]|uniref:RNA pseudouridylate synthase domain-containing protein 3-like protein n=1 Tax=Leptotrombidium deliense TaxID=299467 RepID=A0A443SPS3_9ACAR|nr:RNA pseudouridylate synthase domain-containing protein 3-like protein [Leptotrombidium deliense]